MNHAFYIDKTLLIREWWESQADMSDAVAESIFSDLNNLEVVMTTYVKYADLFGFTENEVYDALEQAELG